MNCYSFVGFFLFLIMVSACKKEEAVLNKDNTLVFGHFYGLCGGEECIENFVLTDEKLLEDTNDAYNQATFNFVELDNDRYLEVRDLIDFFPVQLLNENDGTFGCPDCLDQGGLYIEYNDGRTSRKWRVDQFKSEVPTYLHAFMDKINEKIALIND